MTILFRDLTFSNDLFPEPKVELGKDPLYSHVVFNQLAKKQSAINSSFDMVLVGIYFLVHTKVVTK